MKKLLVMSSLVILALIVLVCLLFNRMMCLDNLSMIGAEGIQEGLIGSDSALNYWGKPEQSKKELEWTVKFLKKQSDKFIEAKCKEKLWL